MRYGVDGDPVGLRVLVVARRELRAYYVVPEAARTGVATALVAELERIARADDIQRLQLRRL
jgi:GNAT superfamily N-acetyltransferase